MSFQHLGKSSETPPKLKRDPTNHDMHFIVEVIDYRWGRCLGWLYYYTLSPCKSMRLHYIALGTKLPSCQRSLLSKYTNLEFSTYFNHFQPEVRTHVSMFSSFPFALIFWSVNVIYSSERQKEENSQRCQDGSYDVAIGVGQRRKNAR